MEYTHEPEPATRSLPAEAIEPGAATVPLPAGARPDAAAGIPSTVGGYRIVRRLGGGGMGDVYVAFDERLHRHVALKSIRRERRLSPGARDRFLREARVLSSLDHPRICAIHDYLEGDDGDYLVLEYIEGHDLAHAIGQLRHADKLRIAAQIADVITTAHASGIVHRDVKPANVMLTQSGDVKVLDFGLARLNQADRDSNERPDDADDAGPARGGPAAARSIFLTQAERAIAGTPRYMSPEQARGDPVGAASDMYSFGLLLQELFTGRGPYDDGLSVSEVVEQAQRGRTRPATGLDRDLTKLIERLKSPDPVLRPTAAETAARLQWIRGRSRRRMRRLAAAAVLGIVAIAGVKYTVDLRRERTQAVAARADADDLIVFMLGDLHDRLAGVGRLDVLGSVSDKSLDYLSHLPESALDDGDLHRRAEALRQIGDVRMAQGDMPAAERAFAESLALATDVVARHPEHPQWLADLGASHFYIGSIRLERRDLAGALEQFDVYRDIADRLVELDGPKPQWRLEQAYAHTNRGAVLEKMGDLAAAAREIEASIAIKRGLVESDPADDEGVRSLANGLSWLSSIRADADDIVAADAARTEELAIRRRLVDADPQHAGDRLMLSRCHVLRGHLRLGRPSRCDEALDDFREAQRIAGDLVRLDPANLEWTRDLAVAHRLVAEAHQCLDSSEAALSELQVALALMTGPVERDPGHAEWRLQLAAIRHRISTVALDLEHWDDALAESRAALAVLVPLAEGGTLTLAVRYRLADAHVAGGMALDGLGRAAEARGEWERALEAIEPAARESGTLAAHKRLAIALLLLDRTADAEPVVRRLSGTSAWDRSLRVLAEEKGFEFPANQMSIDSSSHSHSGDTR